MEVVSYVNFIILLLLIGVLIYQSLMISDTAQRMDGFDATYNIDNKRFDKRYSDMGNKLDNLTKLAVLQQTELQQLGVNTSHGSSSPSAS